MQRELLRARKLSVRAVPVQRRGSPTDPTDSESYDVCTFTFVVKKGVLEERGCDCFPEVIPSVEADRDDISDPFDASLPPMVPAHFSPPYSSPAVLSVAAGGAREVDGGCVDATVMAHLDEADWVFRTPRVASSLCDGNVSYATAGHAAVFRG